MGAKVMKYIGVLIVLFTISACAKKANVVAEAKAPTADRIEKLIAQMTIKEKIGQMTQLNLDVVCEGDIYKLVEPHHIDSAKLQKAIVDYGVGSILNCGGHAYTREQWLDIIGTIQRFATTKSRLKIPVVYGIDAIHGANYVLGSTLFPQPLAQAATFNRALIQRGAEITAYETRAVGIPWNFSPVLDVARHPAWSRVFETYGEDPYVCEQLGAAVIDGYQGNLGKNNVAACMKHFLGYSGMRTGKDRTPALIPEITLREIYLPPFQEAIKRGALTVMINSGEINGVPVHASKDILTYLLRDELKFEGVAVTDWEDIIKLHMNHRVAKDLKEATFLAVDAGIDMCMVPNDYNFSDLLLELVNEGRISEERLNQSVRRVLKLKERLGLLDNTLVPAMTEYSEFASAAHRLAALKTAEESITLLENRNNILPLKKNARVMVAGPAAHSMTLLNGAWTRTWQGTDEKWDDPRMNTILEAMRNLNPLTTFEEGCTIDSLKWNAEVEASVNNSDVVVVCLGEKPSTEKPGDIDDLKLEAAQLEFVMRLYALNKPVVLVLVENRPRIISDISDKAAAVVMAYQPGDFGGEAIANILYGISQPSGRLPFTYPRHNQSLLTYDHKYTETIDQQFGNNAFQPQWEFGHGLTYQKITYSDLRISSEQWKGSGEWKVSVVVKNEGNVAVNESVLLFMRDMYASITPKVKALKRFEKVNIPAQSEVIVEFTISDKDLEFCTDKGKWIKEAGAFEWQCGTLKKEIVWQP